MTSTSGPGPISDGVQASRARKRRVWAVAFGVTGIALAVYAVLIPTSWHAPAEGPRIPPEMAIVGAIMLVLCLTAGVWAYLRVVDELEYRDNLIAFTVGFLFSVSAYVALVVLHTGGLAPNLNFSLIPPAGAAVAAIAYVWLKLKAHLG